MARVEAVGVAHRGVVAAGVARLHIGKEEGRPIGARDRLAVLEPLVGEWAVADGEDVEARIGAGEGGLRDRVLRDDGRAAIDEESDGAARHGAGGVRHNHRVGVGIRRRRRVDREARIRGAGDIGAVLAPLVGRGRDTEGDDGEGRGVAGVDRKRRRRRDDHRRQRRGPGAVDRAGDACVEHPRRVAVIGLGGRVTRHVCERVRVRIRKRTAGGGNEVVRPVMDVRRPGGARNVIQEPPPAEVVGTADARRGVEQGVVGRVTERRVEHDGLTGREIRRRRIDAAEERAGDAGGRGEAAVHEHEAVVAAAVADLGEITSRAQDADVAILHERRAVTPHEVDVAPDRGIADVGLLVELDGVLVAVEFAARDNVVADRVARAVDDQRLGLRAVLRRGVVHGQVRDREVVHRLRDERAAVIDAADVVERVVVRIGDHGLVAVLADHRDEVFRLEGHFLKVGAVLHVDHRRRRIVGRDEIERGLHGVEIPRAVGRHRQARGAGRRPARLGAEAPGRGIRDAGEGFAGGIHERTGVDLHVVSLPVRQHAVARIDRRGITGDRDRVVIEVRGDATDRLRLHGQQLRRQRAARAQAVAQGRRRHEVDRVDDIVGRRIIDADEPLHANDRSLIESDRKSDVRIARAARGRRRGAGRHARGNHRDGGRGTRDRADGVGRDDGVAGGVRAGGARDGVRRARRAGDIHAILPPLIGRRWGAGGRDRERDRIARVD